MRRDFDMVVFAGGEIERARRALAGFDVAGSTVIAADSGVELADALGVTIRCAVGDFDSLDPDRRAELDADPTVEVRSYPSDKDRADLALALDVAVEWAPQRGRRLLVAGVEGGRSDFSLANQLLVAAAPYRSLDVIVALEGGTARVVHDRLRLDARIGDVVSLIPVHGSARVSVSGVRWPLADSTLEAGTTWGMSNEAVDPVVSLTVHDGTVLVFEPIQR